MYRARLSLRSPVAGLVLGLLLVAVGGEAQTATAQKLTFDADQPIQSLKQAAVTAESDSQLVDLATALMKARASTKISHSTYQEGVHYFKLNHSQFYGNFFGDPFYATYDADYFRMTRLRYLASLEVNPFQSSLSTMFFCNPLSYDPAFRGKCQGFHYAVKDFFLVPFRYRGVFSTRFSTPLLSVPRGTDFLQHLNTSESYWTADRFNGEPRRSPATREPRRRLDTLCTPSNPPADGAEPDTPSDSKVTEATQPSDRSSQIQLPDDLHTSMREKVSSLARSERTLRIRQLMEEKYGDRDLSARERFEFAVYLDRVLSSAQQTGTRTRTSERSRMREEYDHSSTLEEVRRLERAVEANADIGSSPELETSAHDRRGTREIEIDRSDLDRAGSEASSPDASTPDRNRPDPDASRGAESSPERLKGSGNNSNFEEPSSSGGN